MAQTIIVDTTPGFRMPTIFYSQGDIGRTFDIDLRSRFGDNLPASPTITIQATKPSGLGFSVAATSISNSVATFTVTDTMTNESGRFPAEIKVVKDSVTLYTANFYIECEASAHPEGTTDGDLDSILPKYVSVTTTTLPAGSSATYSYDATTNTATFGIPKGADGSLASDILAPTYSSSSTYAVGDYVYYNGDLYICNTEISTAEAWTAGHWTQVTVSGELSDVKDDLSETVTVSASIVSSSSINSSGTIISASGMSCYKAKIVSGVKYTVTSHDTSGDLVCGFFYNEPAVNESSYNSSRTVSNDFTFTAPITGWIAFRSAETKTDESIAYTSAKDFVARKSAETSAEKIADYRQLHAVIPNKNIYSQDFLQSSRWIGTDGVEYYNASSYYALIPIVGGNDIAVCFGLDSLYMSGGNVGGFNEYDKDMSLITTQDFGDTRLSEDLKYNDCWVGHFTLDADTAYIAFTAKLSSTWDARTSIIVAYAEDLSDYTGNGTAVASWDGYTFTGKWKGKKWGLIGDSITEANNTADTKYYTLIANKTGISTLNLAVSGSGYAKKADSNEAFTNQITGVTNDCDVVTVFGSGNDNSSGLSLGNITDSGTSTLCGCVNAVIDYMIANHPTIAFGIITPTPWENWEPSDNLYWMAEYAEAIVNICNRRGVPCLDLYHCSNLHPSDASFNTLAFSNADGTHPNNVGHAIIAPRIQAFLDTLLL